MKLLHYRPNQRGVEILLVLSSMPIVGFISEPTRLSIYLLFLQLDVSWFNRKEYEKALELLKMPKEEK